MNTPQNAYIHIPFCNSKCFYCSFVSTCNTNLEIGYLISLLKDIDVNYKKNKLDTLYIGGGTPSILPIEHVKKIINKFSFTEHPEITFELNPENANEFYLKSLIDLGINRLSIGIQSFSDDILKLIGRKHSANEGIEAVKLAKNCGFKNISIDLIYGLPTQKLKDFEYDLDLAIKLDVNHISLYGLKIEEDSVFGKKCPDDLPDEDTQADMYLKAIDKLHEFEHYEISNFAKVGYESKHNLTYWENKPYYAFGCSAHGYEDNIRYANCFDIKKYIENPLIRDYAHFETPKEQLEEEIFLGFRKSSGINVKDINKKFDINFEEKFSEVLKKYLSTNHLKKTTNGYALTNNGFLISNVVLAEFI